MLTSATSKIQTVAHRGASLECPENTMAAFRRAIELGVSAIESDIRLSADGVPVLSHDEDLLRVAGRGERIADLTVTELAAIDAGSHRAPQFSRESIPTLADLVELAHGRAGLVLDLKVAGSASALSTNLRTQGFDLAQVTICAWTVEQAADVRQHLPDVRLRYIDLADDHDANDAWFADLRSRGFAGVSLKWSSLDPAAIEAAHRAGFDVATWTVNDPAEMTAAAHAGVDAIITADPASLIRILAERTAS